MGGSVGDFLESAWDVVGGGLICNALGIESREETITDLQIVNLLTPGVADTTAKRNIRFNTKGNAKRYQSGYNEFKRDYRRKFSTGFLRGVGYEATSTAEVLRPSRSKATEFLKSRLGVPVVVRSVENKFVDTNEKFQHWMVGTGKWDGTYYTDGGKVFALSNVGASGVNIWCDATLTYESGLAIFLQGFTVNAYGEVIKGGNVYQVVRSDKLSESGNYQVFFVDSGGYVNVNEFAREVRHLTYWNGLYASEVTFIEYSLLNDGRLPHNRVYIGDVNDDVYERVTVEMSPIIPLKEDNVLTDFTSTNLEKMLKKLNIYSSDIQANVESGDIDSAYIFMGVDVSNTDDSVTKVMFDYFDYFSKKSGDYSISYSKMEMKYKYSIVRTLRTGSVGAVGTTTRSVTGSKADAVVTLKRQMDSDEYVELVVSGFTVDYVVSGYQITAFIDSASGYCRLLLPLEVLNGLNYKQFVGVYERSLCMLAFSVQVVKIKWYQTSAFGLVLKVAAVVILVVTIGTGAELSATLYALATALVITYAASMIAAWIGGPLGVVIGTAAAVVAMYYAPGMPVMTSNDMWLMAAQQATGLANQDLQHKMDKLSTEYESEMAKLKEDTEEIEELNKKYEDKAQVITGLFDAGYAGKPNGIYMSTDTYCSGITSVSMSYVIDYSKQIDDQLGFRNSVVAGIG